MTLAIKEDRGRIWQGSVPQRAFQHHFLMHGISAILALHLGRLRSDSRERYLTLAAYHKDIAVNVYHSVIQQLSIDNSHTTFCISQFCCSSFIGLSILSKATLRWIRQLRSDTSVYHLIYQSQVEMSKAGVPNLSHPCFECFFQATQSTGAYRPHFARP